MKKNILIIAAFMCMSILSHAQWALKLTSNVYLRTWKLDTKANKEEKEIGGATVTLFQNGKQISQTTSSGGGDFTIMVPKDGEYYLTVTYPGCNTKRMAINTQNVPEKISTDGYKPSFEITGGFIMVKPYPGINYSELSQDLIRVEYTPGKKAFDDTDAGTEKGLGIVSKIYTAEDDLFNRFCSTNKAGDVALAKPDCPLAKTLYEKAIAMIPGEKYPI
ncbi:MAG: carboxypeptidase-like regulatory domain-containing protein, partial [Bacteroidia bacterium]